ncbi:unnamed protein product [Penicillium nalgiovense]|uniref:Mtf2-like C-terminal domain-containing protein n=1 Tax=Penicillium nalgiovense TaxID=60175 RepID=A0A1V6ZAN5_PENNA|nr:hypothetical protein PENNAL_c0001G05139 [Penicillium nalgiovense]CAG7965015.1 unnamed protein product [Penicillium nalgiovense]CAG7966685.1 unnamed protein product [Penicillium nalgiovense]CAG7985541.1 unnamed protein product [Penicillium nalgiovense]CAG7989615.1 unnamed protein product [Penicillium nalgiovense]
MATNITQLCFLSRSTSTAPFLYHTRTLTPLSSAARNQFNRRFPRSFSTQNNAEANDATENKSLAEDDTSQNTSEQSIASSSTSEAAPKPRRSYLQKRAASVSERPSLRPSVVKKTTKTAPKITTQEKLAFGGLLEQLGFKHDGETAEASSLKPMSEEKKAEMAELVSVFNNLLKDPRQKKAASKAKQHQEGDHSSHRRPEKSKTEEQVPTENQGPKRVYLRDLGYSEPATASAAEVTVSLRRAIEIVVKAESEHIEFALFQAIEDGKGDLGVWEVCKERIFSMLRHLDEKSLEEASDPEILSTTDQPEPHTRPSGPLRVPAVVPVAPVVVSLYPKILLIAFRLLNTHFRESPLIPQFRSTIKDYGRVSAFLGASSGLYDELIHYHWRVCKDLPAVVSILREMNQLGINPSSKSRGMLTGLIIRQARDLEAHRKSPSGKTFFWDLPSNKEAFHELTRKDGWMDQIEARSEEEAWQRQATRTSPR